MIQDEPENMFVSLEPLANENGNIPQDQIIQRADYLCRRIGIETKLNDYFVYGNYSSLSLLLSQMGVNVEIDKARGDKSGTDTLRENAAAWGNSALGRVSYALHVAGIPGEPGLIDLDDEQLQEYMMRMYRAKMIPDSTSIFNSLERYATILNFPREYDISVSFLGTEHLIMQEERTALNDLWAKYKQNSRNIPNSLLQKREHYETWLHRSADFYYFQNSSSSTVPIAGEIRNKAISIMPVVFRNENNEPIAIHYANANPNINDQILSRFLSLVNFETITSLMSEEMPVQFNPDTLRATIMHIKDIYVASMKVREFDEFDTIINNQAQMIIDLEEIFNIGRRDVQDEVPFFSDAECALLKVAIYHLFGLNASIRSAINKLTGQDQHPHHTKERDLAKNVIELFTRTLEYSAEEMIKKF